MRGPRVVLFLAVAALAAVSPATVLRADEVIDPIPIQLIERANREILQIQQQSPRLDRPTEAKLARVLEPITNFQEIAEEVLEPYAAGWTIGEWRTLGGLLGKVIRADSLWTLRPYRVDRFELVETSTIFRTVVVKLKAHNGDEVIPVTYHLNRNDGTWYIVDYKVDTVNLIDKYQEHYDGLFKVGFLQPIIDQLQHDLETHPTR